MYCDRRLFQRLRRRREGNFAHPRFLRRGDRHDDHRSLVELRCRLRMYSRTADVAYRTARPILVKRGPSPSMRALASQDSDTLSSLATWAECSRGSISFVFAVELMAHLLSCWRWTEDAYEVSAKITLVTAKLSRKA